MSSNESSAAVTPPVSLTVSGVLETEGGVRQFYPVILAGGSGERFWPLSQAERQDVDAFLDRERIHGLVTLPDHRDDDAELHVADAAFWVKGCSSLGLWRCAALVDIIGAKGRSSFCLLDIKQAIAPLAPRAKGSMCVACRT